MVMSIKEEITALEAEFANAKGPGSKEKRKNLQTKIDELKRISVDEPKKESVINVVPIGRDIPNSDSSVLPKNWRRVTQDQVLEAEKNRKLVGFDPEKMIALIKD